MGSQSCRKCGAVMKVSGCFLVALAFLAVVQGRQKILRDGKEYVYQSEIRVGTGTMDYAPHLVGGVYRMRTRVQVSNSEQTLNVEITDIKKSEYMGPVDPRNQNTNALTFAPAEQASTKFQVNLNADGTFKDFKTEATDPKVTNIIRGWASLFQAKVDAMLSILFHQPHFISLLFTSKIAKNDQ